MNGYVVLGLVMLLIGSLVGYFYVTGGAATKVIIMFGGSGAVITLSFVIAWFKKMYSVWYPFRVKIYGDRYDSFAVKEDTRGKVIKDKKRGMRFIETVNGKRYKMPEEKYIVKGQDMYIDLFDTQDQQFPINIDRHNMEDVRKFIIPESQRAYFATVTIPTVTEATKKPKDNLMQIAAMVSMAAVVTVFVAGMILGPGYLQKSWDFWNKAADDMMTQQQKALDAFKNTPIVVRCEPGEAVIERPEPPPG